MGRKKAILQEVREIDYWQFQPDKQVFVAHQKGNLQYSPEFLRPHRLGYFAIRWLIRGEVKAYVDHIPYVLKAGTLMVANPGQINWFEKSAQPKDFEVRLIVFAIDYFQTLPLDPAVAQRLQGTLKHFLHQVTESDEEIFSQYFDLIEEENARLPGQVRDRLLSPLVAALLQRISLVTEDTLSAEKNNTYVPLYRAFLDTLEQHFRQLHQVEDYVRLLNVSDRRLNRACQGVANTSAGRIIQNRIDFEAKRMLRFGNYSAKEVGYHLGFKDPAHFSKFFKRHNGIPPGKVENMTKNV
ncbi:MAG: helix-turn-helix domain-containing protein [Bacteroidota bacterium]